MATTQSPAHKPCGGHCLAPTSSHLPLLLWQKEGSLHTPFCGCRPLPSASLAVTTKYFPTSRLDSRGQNQPQFATLQIPARDCSSACEVPARPLRLAGAGGGGEGASRSTPSIRVPLTLRLQGVSCSSLCVGHKQSPSTHRGVPAVFAPGREPSRSSQGPPPCPLPTPWAG